MTLATASRTEAWRVQIPQVVMMPDDGYDLMTGIIYDAVFDSLGSELNGIVLTSHDQSSI